MTTKTESSRDAIVRLRKAYETALGDIDQRFPDESSPEAKLQEWCDELEPSDDRLPGWRLITDDDPPPIDTDVLVGSTLYRAEARYIPASKTWYRPTGVVLSFEPSHWMPMPELPRHGDY